MSSTSGKQTEYYNGQTNPFSGDNPGPWAPKPTTSDNILDVVGAGLKQLGPLLQQREQLMPRNRPVEIDVYQPAPTDYVNKYANKKLMGY